MTRGFLSVPSSHTSAEGGGGEEEEERGGEGEGRGEWIAGQRWVGDDARAAMSERSLADVSRGELARNFEDSNCKNKMLQKSSGGRACVPGHGACSVRLTHDCGVHGSDRRVHSEMWRGIGRGDGGGYVTVTAGKELPREQGHRYTQRQWTEDAHSK